MLATIFSMVFCIHNDLPTGAQEFGYTSNTTSLGTNNTTLTPIELFSKAENSVVQVTVSVNYDRPCL